MTSATIYLNGKFLPIESACVSPMDRGFLFGDAVYEVIPLYQGAFVRLDEHLQRLQRSLDAIYLPNPKTIDQWKQTLQELANRNPGTEQAVYLQVSRGAYSHRDLTLPETLNQTVYMMVMDVSPASVDTLSAGYRAITIDDIRWKACNVKTVSLVANVILRRQANEKGAVDAIMVRDGLVTEGTASNVFAVIDDVVVTPPNSQYLLPGITRNLVLELAIAHDIRHEERNLTVKELRSASEIWLTSSTKEVAPVIELDGEPVGDARPGPAWRNMIDLYQQYKEQLLLA